MQCKWGRGGWIGLRRGVWAEVFSHFLAPDDNQLLLWAPAVCLSDNIITRICALGLYDPTRWRWAHLLQKEEPSILLLLVELGCPCFMFAVRLLWWGFCFDRSVIPLVCRCFCPIVVFWDEIRFIISLFWWRHHEEFSSVFVVWLSVKLWSFYTQIRLFFNILCPLIRSGREKLWPHPAKLERGLERSEKSMEGGALNIKTDFDHPISSETCSFVNKYLLFY